MTCPTRVPKADSAIVFITLYPQKFAGFFQPQKQLTTPAALCYTQKAFAANATSLATLIIRLR